MFMATPGGSFLSNKYLIRFCVFVFLTTLCSLEKGYALSLTERSADSTNSVHDHTHHTVQLNSLLPAKTCSPSTRGHDNKKASLEVVHKHGPCSKHNQHKTKIPTHTQILQEDQARVNSIHARLNGDELRQSDTSIPTKSGRVLGSPNYIVTLGLGSPPRQLSLVFDTGSDLTWTQCRLVSSLVTNRMSQSLTPPSPNRIPIFHANRRCALYSNQPQVTPPLRNRHKHMHIRHTIWRPIFSIGYFAKDSLTLTPTDLFDGFLFGCGQDNEGLFQGSAGFLGLGRNKISLIEQTAQKYGRFFSYCLPSTPSSTGYLSFGRGGEGPSNNAKFTPLTTVSQGGSFYGLNVVGIIVGGRQLSIPASVFSSSGAIIDSGTVITRLQATAYSALRDAFRQGMTGYPQAEAFSLLDTCYDFSRNNTISFPTIAFAFGGGVKLDLDASGIFVVVSTSKVCLAFAGNSDDSDFAIFGNVQQKRLQVVYDVAGGKIGFAPAGCP